MESLLTGTIKILLEEQGLEATLPSFFRFVLEESSALHLNYLAENLNGKQPTYERE